MAWFLTNLHGVFKFLSGEELISPHYANMSMQYTAIFHG